MMMVLGHLILDNHASGYILRLIGSHRHHHCEKEVLYYTKLHPHLACFAKLQLSHSGYGLSELLASSSVSYQCRPANLHVIIILLRLVASLNMASYMTSSGTYASRDLYILCTHSLLFGSQENFCI